MIALTSQASAFVLPTQQPVALSMSDQEAAVVQTALGLLQSDFQRVLSAELKRTDAKAQVIIGTWSGAGRERLAKAGLDFSWLESQAQAFILQVTADGRLAIAGSDAYVTA